MKSVICLSDAVENRERRFGAGNEYFPVRLEGFTHAEALFTMDQIMVAMRRAEKNPEDVPPRTRRERLAAWLRRVCL